MELCAGQMQNYVPNALLRTSSDPNKIEMHRGRRHHTMYKMPEEQIHSEIVKQCIDTMLYVLMNMLNT